MNLKTKAFGLLAGTALSLSIMTGAMAQTVSTTLEPAAGSCFAAATSGTIDLGTWNWDGVSNQYEHVAPVTPGSITTNVTQTIQPNIDCSVMLVIGTLTGSHGGSISDFAVTAQSGGTGSGSTYTVATDNDGTDLVVEASLSSVSNTAVPGAYTGTITVDSASSAG